MQFFTNSSLLCVVLKIAGFESRSEIDGRFWNVVLEKDGENQLGRSCEKWRSFIERQRGEEYPTCDSKKANWIGNILSRNRHIQRAVEEKTVGRVEVKGGRGRRGSQLLEYLKGNTWCWKL